MFIPGPAGLIRTRSIFSLAGVERATCVHYWQDDPADDPLTSDRIGSILADLASAWQGVGADDAPLKFMSSSWTLERLEGEDTHSASGAVAELPVGTPGAIDSEPLPPGMAGVVKWTTGHRGRSFRGRTFWPATPEAQVLADGTIIDADLAHWGTSWTNFAAVFNTNAHPEISTPGFSVASFFHQVVPGTPPTVPRVEGISTIVTGNVVRHHMHSQRRRNIAL